MLRRSNSSDFAIRIGSTIVVSVAVMVLLAWIFDLSLITTVLPGLASMKVNTALSFLMLGLAIFFMNRSGKYSSATSRILSFGVLLISGLTLVEYAAQVNLGIDEFFLVDSNPNALFPGRMSVFTAICFALSGLATNITPLRRTAIIFSALIICGFISFSVLASYLFSFVVSEHFASLTTMALHTSLLFAFSTLLIFLSQDSPVADAVRANDPIGRQTRTLLVAALILPLLIAWLVSVGQNNALYPLEFARATIIGALVSIFTIVILVSAYRLRHLEQSRQLLELDHRATQVQLNALAENSPSAIFAKSADGKYTMANQNFATLMGTNPEEIVGKSAREVFDKDLAREIEDETSSVLESGHEIVSERRFRVNEQEIVLHCIKFPLKDAKGNIHGVGGIWTDISLRAQLIEDLRRSNAELEQFAYVASHDLQEPLRMVSSYMQLLESRYRDNLDQDAKDFIDFAVDGANRMQRLIQDLLAFSRVGTRGEDPEPVQSREALDMALRNLTNTIDQNEAQLEIGELPEIKADFNQLVLVFQNLIGNAIKFRSEAPPLIQISAQLNGDMAEFSIKDNGIGFDTKHTDRIFVIFQRLNNRAQYGGTGIGLAICKKIIERLGGRIWVDSREGHGSTFHFSLPLTDAVIRNFRPTTTKDQAETVEARAGRML